jgi:hypothetical protein
MLVQFRPHHFLCALCFQGRGYSPAFVANFQKILDALQTDESLEIEVTLHTDSICSPCPSRLEKQCASQEKVSRLDRLHQETFALEEDMRMTWSQAKERIAATLTMPRFHEICSSCSWKALGICEEVLTKFLNNPHKS